MRRSIYFLILLSSAIALRGQTPQPAPSGHPVHFFVFQRGRGLGWDWFKALQEDNIYGYGESLLRFGLSQTIDRWDWKVEITQGTIIDAPNTAVSSSSAQASWAWAALITLAAATILIPRPRFLNRDTFVMASIRIQNIRIGRFEFFDGLETKPKNPTLAWLQPNRVGQRLVSNFGFTNAQRSSMESMSTSARVVGYHRNGCTL